MIRRFGRAVAVLIGGVPVVGMMTGCNEPVHRVAEAPRADVPRLMLDVSDSTPAVGSTIRITIRARGIGLASATGRIVFDTTALGFAAEEPMADGGMRVINPSGGMVRFAAVARDSFADGVIDRLDLVVKTPGALRALHVSLDEAHTPARRDATQSLRGAP